MGIDNFFKGLLAGLSASSRDDILRRFSHTRLGEHYDQVENLCENLPRNTTWILIGLLTFGNDDMYLDILDFAVTFKLQRVYDYFKIISDKVTLEAFMDELDVPTDKRRKTAIFVGEADEASVKIGEQSLDSSYVGTLQEKTVQFSDDQPMNVLELCEEADSTRKNEDNMITSNLGAFLTRPQIIQQYTWTPATSFIDATNSVYFAPYKLYLDTAAISRKADNYRLFRCTGLKLQFRINGSPFHYGRLYAAWRPGNFNTLPYPGQENPYDTTVAPDNMGTFNSFPPLLTHFSQWPGVFIDPATNEPQEMIIPFMWNQNYISLVNTTDATTLGQVCIFAMNGLRHANGSTSAVTVTVTASIVDPVLSVPTDKLAFSGEASVEKTKKKNKTRAGSGTMEPSKPKTRQNSQKTSDESTSSNDEYGKGAVSAPATAIASFAGTLEKVPFIGPYATATKIAAGKISSIAKLFGYSNPVNLSDTNRIVIDGNSGLASTIGTDAAHKLTLDPKQELTVDPNVVGLQSIDEMSFAHIFKRESLLVQIPWEETDPGSTLLANIAVGPWNKPINNANGILFHTALSWGSYPFLWWRGSLRYRFQIVCSQNHRGRLSIVYNPNEGLTALPEQAQTYQYFMDLAETKDMTVTVRHASQSAWLINNPPSTVFITGAGHTFTNAIKASSNGIISVYVLNELGAPINTADVTINVFISAGDDFMVAAPGGPSFEKFTPYAPILDAFYGNPDRPFVGEADVVTQGEGMPMSVTDVVLNGDETNTPDVDNINNVFFGEQVVSLRALLKRYSFYTAYFPAESSPSGLTRFEATHCLRPMSRGGAGRGNDQLGLASGTLGNYNVVYTTLLDYYSRGYVGYRGSVRWKYILGGGSNTQLICMMRARRYPVPMSAFDRYDRQVFNNVTGLISDTEAVRTSTYMDDGAPDESYTGTCLSYIRNKNSIEFEHPFYSTQRFHFMARFAPGISDATNVNGVYQAQSAVEIREAHKVDLFLPAASATVTAVLETYCAAGEDFSLHYFLGAPVVGFSNFVP